MLPKQPNFDYFYGIESDQFTFYRIPKELFTNSYFNDLSTEAKLLYGLMLDRMSLSRKNEWFDSENRVFVIFTQEDARDLLKCSKNKVVTFFAELDKYGLITRKKQGQGKPTIIYIMNIYSITSDYDSNEYANEDISKDENLSEETNEELPSECAALPDVKNDFGESMSEDCQIQTSQNRKSRIPKAGSQDFPEQIQEVKTSQNR